MLLIGILIFALAFAYLAWKNLEWALLVLVFLLPTYLIRFNVGVPMTVLEFMILIIFVVWFWQNRSWLLARFKRLETGKNILPAVRYPFAWPLAAWLLISLLAVFIGGSTMAAFGIWRAYFFEPALLYIVVVNICSTRERFFRLFSAFGVSAIVISLFALYQYLTGNFIANTLWASVAGRRATSFFPYPNAIGLYLAPIALLIIGMLSYLLAQGKSLFKRRWKIVLATVTVVACVVAIYCARSEGAALGLAAGFFVFALAANKKLRLAALSLIILGGIAFFTVPKVHSVVKDNILLHTFSGQVRRAQWHETWKMLKDGRLLSGAGLNAYQKTVAPYHVPGMYVWNYDDPHFLSKIRASAEFRAQSWQPLEIYMYPHSIVLNFWSELGLLGVIGFFWIIVMFFIFGIRAYRIARRAQDPFAYAILGLMTALLATIVHGLVDVPYFKNDLAVLFWIMMGMISFIEIEARKKTINS